jgi:hypothetical protein
MTPHSTEHIKQWQAVNKSNSGNRKLNQGLCKNCQADYKTCSNDCIIEKGQVSYCSYLNPMK